MPLGWNDLTEYRENPNWQQGVHPYHQRWHSVKTGEQQCPDCFFETHFSDPVGHHTCPQLPDGDKNSFTIGDTVYVYARSKIRKAVVTKWKHSTKKLSVEELDDDRTVHVINSLWKVLKIDEQE